MKLEEMIVEWGNLWGVMLVQKLEDLLGQKLESMFVLLDDLWEFQMVQK